MRYLPYLLMMLSVSAHAGSQGIECGQSSDIFLDAQVDWHTNRGVVKISGELFSEWSGLGAEPIELPCTRQGGSSMRPYWVCEGPLADDQTVRCVFAQSRNSENNFANVYLQSPSEGDVHRALHCAAN